MMILYGILSRLDIMRTSLIPSKRLKEVNLDQSLMALYINAPFMASFLAGILTFLSPCILPLIPPYMSYISNVSIQESKNPTYRFRIVYTSLLFIAGFSLVFIVLGIFASTLLGKFFSIPFIHFLAGIIIIFFGIYFLLPARFQLYFLTRSFSLNLEHSRFGFFAPFMLGICFSIGWSPCVGPILTSILTLSVIDSKNALWLMMCYCLGLGASFLLVALFLDKASRFIKHITPFTRIVGLLSGLLLILIGILIMIRKTDFLVL